MFFVIEDGSMSMWMISACGEKASTLPVTRSSKRAPTATRHVGVVHRHVGVVGPVHAQHLQRQRVRDGNAPSPIRVVVTGICVSSASSRSSARASEEMTPPPT